MLGPVLERLHDELLDPLIRRVFAIMVRNGLVPDPPCTMGSSGGMPAPLQIEFISLLASAQKAAATGALERFWRFGQAIAQLKPEAIDRLDADGTLHVVHNQCAHRGAMVVATEKGNAPDRITASANAANKEIPSEWSPARTRPLCPWPAFARYKGGDLEQESSFECVRP